MAICIIATHLKARFTLSGKNWCTTMSAKHSFWTVEASESIMTLETLWKNESVSLQFTFTTEDKLLNSMLYAGETRVLTKDSAVLYTRHMKTTTYLFTNWLNYNINFVCIYFTYLYAYYVFISIILIRHTLQVKHEYRV